MIAYDRVCERKEISRIINDKHVEIIFFFFHFTDKDMGQRIINHMLMAPGQFGISPGLSEI